MIIKIDIRETELLNCINKTIANNLNFNKIIIQSVQLPIGDIIISDETEEKIIIERKTIHDLQASIKDGRYEEQSYRLNGLPNHNHNIIYLIEGDANKINKFIKVDTLSLYSAMFSLNYYKGFSLFRTISLEETAKVICNMAYKLEKMSTTKKAFYSNNLTNNLTELISENTKEGEENESKEDKNYVSCVKKVKKDNITTDNIGEIMLCQIPGISSVTALAIMAKYKSISNLIKEIEINRDCLKDISYTTTKGQTRKINKTSISNIIKYLLN
jgi:ERCC4-type nuclease